MKQSSPRLRRERNGFTLMELLIVIAIIVVLMLLALPTVGSLRKSANRVSAIKSLQAIHQSEIQYAATYPANGFACSLTALGGEPSSGAPSPTSAQILPNDLASGFKSGYIFTIANCTKITVNGQDRITGYNVTALPQTVGKTGDNGFCSDENAEIKYDPAGGSNCTQSLQ